MSSSTSPRIVTRIATALAATAVAGVLVAAPASARPDPGTGGTDPYTGPATGRSVIQEPRIPDAPAQDDGTEYLQVGAGLLAGLALAGAVVAVASRRHPREITPA